jgi:large subunit ribosomal protein L24
MEKIRKGDEVVVITGRDKGKRGTVSARIDERHVMVDGINVVKKHARPNPMKGVAGGIIDKVMPIDQSNLMVFNPGSGKGDRVGFRMLEDGTKVRVFRSNGEQVKA